MTLGGRRPPQTPLPLINQKNVFSDQISSLERALEEKNKELREHNLDKAFKEEINNG